MALVRILVLVALLVASGPLQSEYARTRFVFTQDGAISSVPPWLALIALAVVFILAAGARREQRQPTALLIIELVVAVLIAIVPPLIWAQVLPGLWTEAMGGTTGASYAQMLAVVWAMLVVRTMRSRRRAG
jgi:hypothetical protein